MHAHTQSLVRIINIHVYPFPERYVCACARVCVCVCVRACMRAFVCARARVCTDVLSNVHVDYHGYLYYSTQTAIHKFPKP